MAYKPDLFIFAGDNVYGDTRNGREIESEADLLDSLRQAYVDAGRVRGLATVRSTVRHLATWDDHDYGKNDAGADFRWKREAQAMFLDFWRVRAGDPRRGRDGVYHAETIGPPDMRVQVILPDTRANGVVILSGDRHVGGLYREADGTPYPLTEITSSGLTQVYPGNREPGPNRLGAVYGLENFGTIDVDWWDGTMTLSVRAMNGEPARRTTLRIADLRVQP
jgi:hypothetical protein